MGRWAEAQDFHDLANESISLLDDEATFSKMVFNLDEVMSLKPKQSVENGELAASLMKSLISSGAIPEVRLRYMTWLESANADHPEPS